MACLAERQRRARRPCFHQPTVEKNLMRASIDALRNSVFAAITALLACASAVGAGDAVKSVGTQWRVAEFTFTATNDYRDPLDFPRAGLSAEFAGPDGRRLYIAGFWDGGRVWKVRFTPTCPGRWTYRTKFTTAEERGLHGREGELAVAPASDGNALRRHGGFVKVSANRRCLTYSDGTPLFWLGDTWWNCPSENVPLPAFKEMVDLRVKQGYTVFQAHGHRALVPDGPDVFQAVRSANADAIQYWREVDKYIAYAEEQGLIGVIGFAGHSLLDPVSLDDLKRLWQYYLARYGAYPLTFLITQEYNAAIGDLERRLPKMLALGQFIHEIDPYQRAMSVHPWCLSRDKREAWNEPWHDFIMLQAGHRWYPGAKRYTDIYRGPPVKPMLESEANYEGFEGPGFHVDAACIRRTAYSAIQSGCFGFTYGAQGLYAGVLSKERPLTTARWGPVLTWREALTLPGGAQMQHLRKCYESVAWWKLEPRPGAAPGSSVLVKADADRTYLLYYLPQGKVPAEARLTGVPKGATYRAAWFDPRGGQTTRLPEPLAAGADGLALPTRPDQQDWMLVLTQHRGPSEN